MVKAVYTISDKIEEPAEIRDHQKADKKHQKVRTSDHDTTIHYGRYENLRIWKNVVVIGFAFMIHFTAFWGASNLQSSINADDALGTFTLAAIYGSLILSNIFLPVMVIRWLGVKWTIVLSFIAYMPFIMAQFYPKFYTMIPAGLAVGFGGGPLWCAKCTYLTIISETYSQITDISSEVAVTRFFGVFFMFYQFSQVWGNLISSAVLSTGSSTNTTTTIINETFTNLSSIFSTNTDDFELEIGELCGANFCPIVTNDNKTQQPPANLQPPEPSKIQLIASIYLICMIFACLIVALGVDPIDRYGKNRKGSGSGLSGFRLLSVTLKQLGNPYQILILPITMFIGAEQAFIAADFNAAFVGCGWGISNIGFVMVCFGVCNGIAAIFIGSIIKITGRSPVICFALTLHVILIITMLIWQPDPSNKLIFFAISALWGICDAMWLVQINSLSGLLFPGNEEAAYSNFRLWESTGSVITYVYSPYLCTNIKLYLLLGLLLVGVSGYTTIAFLQHRNKRSSGIREKTKL